jgi:anti-sigma regulatory factor (Ser/Thr protein kinase)
MDRLRLPARLESLDPFRHFVLNRMREWELSPSMVPKVELVLEEVLANIVHYAYPGGATGDMEVECFLDGPERFCLTVEDWGDPFDPMSQCAPELTKNLFERQVGGLGIFLVRRLVNELRYRRDKGRNILTLCFEIEHRGQVPSPCSK